MSVAARPRPFRRLVDTVNSITSFLLPRESQHDAEWPADQIGPRPRASADDARRRASEFLAERRQAVQELLSES